MNGTGRFAGGGPSLSALTLVLEDEGTECIDPAARLLDSLSFAFLLFSSILCIC